MEIFLTVLIVLSFITPFLIWTFLNFTGYKAQSSQMPKWKIVAISLSVSFTIMILLILALVATIN